MKTLSFLTLLCSFVSAVFAADPVQLLLPDPVLKPSSSFEVRFSEPMIEQDAIGQQVESPLVITPPMTGKWTWMSDSSGVFVPSEPPPLATTFKFSLKSGLKNLAGKTVKASFKETVATPPFEVKGSNSYNANNTEDATEFPAILLLFSAAVKASDAAPHAWFIDDKGNKIAARVEQGVPGRGYDHRVTRYQSSDRSIQTWEEQFAAFRKPGAPPKEPNEDEEESGATNDMTPQSNLLRVTPVSRLPEGTGWKFNLEDTLTSADGNYELDAGFEFEIGTVLSFSVGEVKPENLLYSGKRLEVTFAKQISKEAKKELAKWVSVQPEVPNLKITVNRDYWDGNGTQIFVEGDFELAKEYTLKVAAGLPGNEGLVFPKEYSKKVSFGPVASRLYFQDLNAQQQASGTRKFHVQNINVSKFKITAKLINPDAKAAAWIAYRKYHEAAYSSDVQLGENEYFAKVDEALFSGDVVWEKEITNDSPVDKRKVFPFSWDEVLGAGKSGMVLLTVEQVDKQAPNVKRVGAQTLVQVTDLGVAWKSAKGVFLYVFSHTTGEPVGGANVTLVDADGKTVADAKTADDGTARLPAADNMGWLLVSQGGDQHLVAFGQERRDQEFGRFRISADGTEQDVYDFGGVEGGRRGLMFSDRPVYKPGETVHLKAIVRHGAGQKPLKKAVLVVKDSRSQPVFTGNVTLSESGAMNVDVPMPADMVGYFNAKLAFEDEEQNDWGGVRHNWRVEEYEPNSFEVKLAMPEDKFVGDKIEVPMSSNYYMGKPLSKANFLWSVRAYDDSFMPEGFGAFRFCNSLMDYRLDNIMFGVKTFSQQGEMKLGKDGTAIVDGTIPPNDKLPQPRRARVLVEVTDTDQQTVAQRQEFTLHSSDFYLGVNHGDDVVREGDTLPLQIIAVKKDGAALEKQVPVTVKLSRVDWHTNRVEDADDAENYRSEPTILPVAEETIQTLPVKRKAQEWEADGATTLSEKFKLTKPGMYMITAEAKDDGGRKVITCTTVYVYGKEETVWNYRNRFQIELVADKPEYLAGDEATIMVKTPIAGKALVTVEREGVRSHFVTKLEGNSPTVKIPIKEADAPNVYVSVMVFRGSNDSPKKYKMPEYRLGYARLEIKRPEAALAVSVKPVRTEYRPGEEAEVICNVQDHVGKPVADAEVTLWAADEGVLSLTGFETPNPLSVFLEIIRLTVSTGLTLPQLLDEDPETMSFENKGYLVGGFGKGGEPNVRRNFLGTAFWEPTLKTDADGNVRAKFKVPDGLTRYRILAVVQNTKDQFGKSESAFTINKPFMLEPSPPRFARTGDKVVVRAVLHNTTAQDAEAEVKLELDAFAKSDETTKKIALPAGATAVLDFPVELQGVGEAVWTWLGTFTPKDGSAAFTDNVETRLNVTYPVPLANEVLQQRVDEKTIDLLAAADPALRDGTGKVAVTVSNSRIIALREGLHQLLVYPYGCVEQTTSSLLPWLALRDFRTMLPGLGKTDEEYNQAISKGINRLFKMQTSTGGLAYWSGGTEPIFWGSAYGMTALARAQRDGIAISEYDMERLRKYLSDQLRGSEKLEKSEDLSPYIMACYGLALAGKAEPAYHEMYYKKRTKLSQENRALLALAILESGGAKPMAETLLKMTDKKVEEDRWFGSIARAQGIRLMAWSLLSPKSDATGEIAKALFEQRTDGHWSTTQGNLWAILGISDYVRKTEVDRKETKGTLAYGDAKAEGFQLSAKGGFQNFEFPLQGKLPLTLENTTGGTLYTFTKLEVRPAKPIAERVDRGYSIKRRYDVVDDDGSVGKLFSGLQTPRVGDRVLVTLNLSVSKDTSYLAIEDSLPAVFEAINSDFQSQETNAANLQQQPWTSYQEIRADRAMFFADRLWKGNHIIRYLVRVRAAGTATAPPAKIEEMYHPERFGSSETTEAKTKPME